MLYDAQIFKPQLGYAYEQMSYAWWVYLYAQVILLRMRQRHLRQRLTVAKSDFKIHRMLVAKQCLKIQRLRGNEIHTINRPECFECALLSGRQATTAQHEAAYGPMLLWFVQDIF